jgi:hypothetical protein
MWNWLIYDNGMSHAVTDDLLVTVLDDLASMDPPGILIRKTKIVDVSLDQGGMAYVDHPVEKFDFDGLSVSVPSEDLGDLAERWRVAARAPARGPAFYRFTGWPWRCIVVDPGQRQRLLDLARSLVDVAERRAFDFFAGRQTPQEAIQARNEAVLGKEAALRIPHGPDKNIRFRSS